MRPSLLAWMIFTSVVTGGIGAGGCSYDPQPLDGTLRCASSGECPQGYTCAACGTCWLDSLGASTVGPLSGRSIPQAVLNRYVGDWALSTCANVVTTCNDGSSFTNMLSPDSSQPSLMSLTVGSIGTADLVSNWLCTLDLSLETSGAHLYGNDQGCSFPNPNSPTLTETWEAKRFDVVTTSATTAVHSATYLLFEEQLDLTIVTCTQYVHAPMTKLTP